jgi:hypothetical protein
MADGGGEEVGRDTETDGRTARGSRLVLSGSVAGEIFSRNIQGVCKWATMAPTVYAFYYYVLLIKSFLKVIN